MIDSTIYIPLYYTVYTLLIAAVFVCSCLHIYRAAYLLLINT